MQIKRILEVWEKGLDGAPLGTLELNDDLPLTLLQELLAHEQDRPDPEMRLAYLLDAPRALALQPWCAQQLDPTQFDYILSAYGLPDLPQNVT